MDMFIGVWEPFEKLYYRESPSEVLIEARAIIQDEFILIFHPLYIFSIIYRFRKRCYLAVWSNKIGFI